MPRKLQVTLIGLCFIVMSVGLLSSEANAGCAVIGGKYMCASWITGSNIDNIAISGVGKICDPGGTNCKTQALAAVGGTIGSNPNCNDNQSNFPSESDNCGVQGIQFCLNPAGNAQKAQGQPYTLNAVLEGVSNIKTCDRNGKCKTSIILEPTADQMQCINSNWIPVGFTATKYKAKTTYCDSIDGFTNLAPLTCGSTVNPGTIRTLIELCDIDPNLVTFKGGQAINCTLLGTESLP